jgi:hypothetical protein
MKRKSTNSLFKACRDAKAQKAKDKLSKMFCATPLTKDGRVPKNVYRSPLTCGTLEEAREHAARMAVWNPGKTFVVVDANNEIVD